MFRCYYTIFRQFTFVSAKVMNYYNDKIQYSSVTPYNKNQQEALFTFNLFQ